MNFQHFLCNRFAIDEIAQLRKRLITLRYSYVLIYPVFTCMYLGGDPLLSVFLSDAMNKSCAW